MRCGKAARKFGEDGGVDADAGHFHMRENRCEGKIYIVIDGSQFLRSNLRPQDFGDGESGFGLLLGGGIEFAIKKRARPALRAKRCRGRH